MCMQKYKRHELLQQAGRSDDAKKLAEKETAGHSAEVIQAEQQAKAGAKKAKKQRQKAKKQQQQVTQTQTQTHTSALTPRSAEPDSDTSLAWTAEPESSPRGVSEALSEAAASVGVGQSSAAEEGAVGLQGGEDTSRDSSDADMLEIFRCPICKVGRTDHMMCKLLAALPAGLHCCDQ